MTEDQTVGQLIEIAIVLERSAEQLYHDLETKFSHHAEVAQFWKRYANEEAGHARWLERLKERCSPEQLSARAEPAILDEARKTLQLSNQVDLGRITNLNQAYELVVELENSETNAIFDFLITNFAGDEGTAAFLRAQLRGHIANISEEFPTELRSAMKRKQVRAA